MGRTVIARDMAAALLALGLPLFLWARLYPVTDWAALALGPLAVMLFAGVQDPALALNRARLAAVLHPGTLAARWLTGRLSALWRAGVFVLIAVPVLAWQALVTSGPELICLGLLCLAAGSLAAWLRRRLDRQVTPPFARWAALAGAAGIAAVAALPVLAWVNWALVPRPPGIGDQSLAEAVQAAMAALPDRRGWIAEGLAPIYAADAARLWAAVRFQGWVWPVILYCVQAGLVGAVVARSMTALMDVAAQARGGR